MARTITSANAVYLLGITGLYPTAQELNGYMADAAFETEAADTAEVVLGVDGYMSSGWVPRMYRQTISLMPDSTSSNLFEDWVAAQDGQEEIYPAFATITLKATGRVYALANGVLTSYQAIPGARKVLSGRPFIITWNTITPAPLGTSS